LCAKVIIFLQRISINIKKVKEKNKAAAFHRAAASIILPWETLPGTSP
jgi:hypothetical protein